MPTPDTRTHEEKVEDCEDASKNLGTAVGGFAGFALGLGSGPGAAVTTAIGALAGRGAFDIAASLMCEKHVSNMEAEEAGPSPTPNKTGKDGLDPSQSGRY